VLLRNVGGNKNHSVRLDLTGFADNKTALGAKVEVFAGGTGRSGAGWGSGLSNAGASANFSLASAMRTTIDLLAHLVANGRVAGRDRLAASAGDLDEGVDRRGSSCPVLFAWDGHKYKLVTDVIGAAVVGHWFTPTRATRLTPASGSRLTARNLRRSTAS